MVLPLFITFGLLYWLFSSAEQLLSIPIKALLPAGWYVSGMGVLSACALIFASGILVQNYLTKHFFQLLEWLLSKIPLVNTFYGSARDLMQFAFGKKDKDMRKVVSVEIREGIRLLGFITNENISLGSNDELLAVYFPMSYQVGGYLAYMPVDKCEMLDMSVETAMQRIFTAHVSKPQ